MNDLPEQSDSEKQALEHGFTSGQWRAAKSIELRIFGPYQWLSQGDRAASMFVAIMQAIKDAEASLVNEIEQLKLQAIIDEGSATQGWAAAERAEAVVAAAQAFMASGVGKNGEGVPPFCTRSHAKLAAALAANSPSIPSGGSTT